jgi:hypothetical protein
MVFYKTVNNKPRSRHYEYLLPTGSNINISSSPNQVVTPDGGGDVIAVANYASLPAPANAETGKIYIDVEQDVCYIWDSEESKWVKIADGASVVFLSNAPTETGVANRLYIDATNKRYYAWSGSAYTDITPPAGISGINSSILDDDQPTLGILTDHSSASGSTVAFKKLLLGTYNNDDIAIVVSEAAIRIGYLGRQKVAFINNSRNWHNSHGASLASMLRTFRVCGYFQWSIPPSSDQTLNLNGPDSTGQYLFDPATDKDFRACFAVDELSTPPSPFGSCTGEVRFDAGGYPMLLAKNTNAFGVVLRVQYSFFSQSSLVANIFYY